MTSPAPVDPVVRLRQLYEQLQALGYSLYRIHKETKISRQWSSAFLLGTHANPLASTLQSHLEKLEALLKQAQASDIAE